MTTKRTRVLAWQSGVMAAKAWLWLERCPLEALRPVFAKGAACLVEQSERWWLLAAGGGGPEPVEQLLLPLEDDDQA